MGILPLGKDKILDISNFTFDQLKYKIIQKRGKYFPNEPNQPIYINTGRVIVSNTKTNPKEISSVGVALCSSH